ncbi:hypothetical protein F5Y04DRAFT_153419 [Hypomontagnella monticulosa]|nr:hypothetical protein F5Y04DRAFT_153419 [Hypomontagnella monticulosa]
MTDTDTDTDSDPELGSSPRAPAPQTPPRSAKGEHRDWLSHPSHHAPATPKSSPPVSPSLSLHSLGMSPFSPARRQFPSPLARSPSYLQGSEMERSEKDDLVRDSRDVLIQRLNDLVAQISQQDHLKEDNINGLHAKVDEMERAITTRNYSSRRTPWRTRPTSLELHDSESEHNSFWGSLTPGRMVPSISNLPLHTRTSSATQTDEKSSNIPRAGPAKGRQISPAQADLIVAEAQNLCKELENVASGLRARLEESDHIHEMLITRAERAAQRIIQLEKRVKELESERNEGEMEMLNLQIQLKAIEVQCLSYVPEDADKELRESISVWKSEWAALKRKRARRKAAAAAANEELGIIHATPSRQPSSLVSPGKPG